MAADAHFSSVVLLALNESGADGGTTFDDASNTNHTLTANGNAQWDTAQKPSGLSSSGLFDGTGDFISAADHVNWHFAAGNFTLEGWVRFSTTVAATKAVWGQWANPNQHSWLLQWNTNAWRFAYSADGTNVTLASYADATVAIDTWYHVAIVRSGTTLRCWRDGVEKGSSHNIGTTSLLNSTTTMRIGSNPDGAQDWNGWQAAARFTKGVARYTADFTPPSLPLPTTDTEASTGAGKASVQSSTRNRRRRFIFPDGTEIIGSMEEARQLLEQFTLMKPETATKKRGRPKLVRVPKIEIEKVEFKPAGDTVDDGLLMPILPNRIFWKPDPTLLAQAVARLRRKIDDEETLIALMA